MAKRPTDEAMKTRALDRWNNEGGAPVSTKRPKRPRDPNQLGKLIVDLSVGEAEDAKPEDESKNPAAKALGRWAERHARKPCRPRGARRSRGWQRRSDGRRRLDLRSTPCTTTTPKVAR